ncbi:TIGR04255 family protein [Aphanothece sacrum]|uniref:TIGR04255 family protein n=1 Tax=Aphanothece sacrum FPU1 TaxID=1920663 RepID=A0A401IF03_APHSA|nr:TIGR04255 family protein [Aphanothece sacrum]GBF79760.1 hypothetical protein AsFPU1_1159 [Aphanothece sacrum FPU1]GBF84773.1 hypothetical protein AsFPU3_1827 [Aphanothece sacrum FPU3]
MNTITFNKLPIFEIIFGVEFETISFSSAYLGLYWETIKDRFPETEDQSGNFEDETSLFGNSVSVVSFANFESDRLIKFSNSSFLYSYIRPNDDNNIDFKDILQEFIDEWHNFKSWYSKLYLDDEPLLLNLKSYNFNFVCLIDKDLEWSTPKDNPKIFKFINNIEELDNELELFDFKLMLRLPNSLGVVHISSEQRIRLEDESMVKFLILSSKSMEEFIYDDDDFNLSDWLTSIYEYNLEYLMKLTTEKLQEKWR